MNELLNEDIRRCLDLNERELYIQLADKLAEGFAAPTDIQERIETGKRVFQNWEGKLRGLICNEAFISKFLTCDDEFALASAVAEVMAEHFKAPASIGTLAVLIARQGLKSFCRTTA